MRVVQRMSRELAQICHQRILALVGRASRDLSMQRSMKRLARNAFRISISAIHTYATVMLSNYSAKAEFIRLSDFDNTAVVTDLNNLGVPAPHIFATPLKVGIYIFTTDSGQLGYGASGLNNSNALSTTTDLGWMKIDIDPSAPGKEIRIASWSPRTAEAQSRSRALFRQLQSPARGHRCLTRWWISVR